MPIQMASHMPVTPTGAAPTFPVDGDLGAPLEAVYELDGDEQPATADLVAERLRVDGPRARAWLDALCRGGQARRVGDGVRLTPEGRRAARTIIRRHRLAERLLADVVGLDWAKVHREARRWEQVISAEVEEQLVERLGDPGTCPHGNPIPGSANAVAQADAIPLSEAPEGVVRVVRIAEELEEDDAALRLLEDAGFLPGRYAEVLSAGGGADVKVAGTVADAVVPARVAALTYVEMADPGADAAA